MRKAENFAGRRYGRLAVIRRIGRATYGAPLWECVCDCGVVKHVTSGNLDCGRTLSCGCWQREERKLRKKHGQSKTRTYNIWCGIKKRCCNPKAQFYHLYGGRGLKLYDRWHKFENFLADMGKCPAGLSIERLNVDIGYEPGNCCWATNHQQSRNRRTTLKITYNGITRPMIDWAHDLGINYDTLRDRIFRRNWPPERALTTPVSARS